jgi:hypothetical protein
VTRYVKPSVQYMLWGKAAGRCEFDGCNKPLWKSPVTQEQVNIAEKAHIYSFSEGGSRGHDAISDAEINDIRNLMLVCTECHETIDKEKDGGRYSAPLLQAWKEAHERRIELVTGIDPLKKSHILLYGARIGDQSSPLRYALTAPALFPDRHPADDKPLAIDTVDGHFNDRSASY